MNSPVRFRPAARLAGIGVSEILARGAAAAALQRSGKPMIILGAGEPDFDTPDHIKDAACQAIRDGKTKYTQLDGAPELKEAVRNKFLRVNGLRFESNQITCGAGAKQILYNAFMASLEPGDEVIMAAPYWTSYADIVTIAGGVPIVLTCDERAGFLLTPAQLEAGITSKTRWLLLNSPSNPSGAAYSRDQLAQLAEVIRRHEQIWVMSDDIYEHIVFDGFEFTTFANVAPDLADRTLTINGVSKAYAMTGWRIGYGAGPRDLIASMAVVQSQSTSCPSSISQAAAVTALNGPQDRVQAYRDRFEQRRDLVVSAVNAISGLHCAPPQGTFYAFANCGGIIGSVTPGGEIIETDRQFADYLVTQGVAVIPGACFGLAPFIRISFAASDLELTTALQRIATACARLTKRGD